MRRVLAITALTWKAAFRFRLFWVLAGLLLATVVGLPLLLKDDGTARGFTQILLTYTLSLTTALLGFATLWLACGTLARDIEDCQMQMIAVKPISRWQVWLGKWLGIVLLDAALLSVAGASVYGLLRWRAQQLPEKERAILRNEIFVARGSLKEPPPELEADTDRIFRERIQETPVPAAEQKAVRDAIREQLKAGFQIVPPDHLRRWTIDLVMVPLFRLILRVTTLAAEFSPVDSLSTGRSVSWGQLGLAWAQTVLLLGGVCGAVGITIFTRRELATASGAT